MSLRRSICTALAVAVTASVGLEGVFGFVAPLPSATRVGPLERAQAPRASASTAEARTTQYTLDKKPIGGPLSPISSNILVKVRSKDDTSDGGIILPEKAKEKPTEGVVIAMGPGRTHPETGMPVPSPCAVGDKVLYGKYDGTAVDYMGEDHQFVRGQDILFVYAGERMQPDTIKMIRDEILVKVDPEVTESKSGLLLGVKEEDTGSGPSTGEVVAVGPGRTADTGDVVPMTVQTGDLIKFRDFAGSPVKMQGTDYRVMKIEEVLAKW